MATTGYKAVYATELDANDSTNMEGELGVLRAGTDGIIYRYVQAGATGWATAKALVESTPGTNTTLIPTTVGNPQPIEAVSQSTVTALYFGWVIDRGACAVYTEGCGQGDPLFGGAATSGYARVMPPKGRKHTRLRARLGGACNALASAEMV